MPLPELRDFGLDEALADQVRAREARSLRGFTQIMAWGSALIWLCWSVGVFVGWRRPATLSRVLLAALLGLLAALLAALPLSMVAAVAASSLWPRHPKADDLERYEKARTKVRTCDVCVRARGDHGLKPDVSFCVKCNAWICERCRSRLDLRAIAALKQRLVPPREP